MSIWHRLCRLVMAVGWAVVLPMCAAAQEDRSGAAADTVYVMQEIVVQGAERVEPRSFTLQRLPAAAIEQASAASAAQIARYVPSAHVKTNSRGETLLYLRGVGERQTAVFFDGALLNIPWDNRLDLGLIPAGLVGGMTVAKGSVGVEYGANVFGGVVNLTSPALAYEGGSTGVSVLYGTGEAVQTRLIHRGSTGAFSYAGSLGYARHDGVPLPAAADLPFNQRGGDLRTNTDRRVTNAFARGVYAGPSGVRLGVTLLHIDAVQGVAPEGHIPTAEVRLWRYPDWRYMMAIMSGEGPAGTDARWESAVWLGRFGQRIDAFGSLDSQVD